MIIEPILELISKYGDVIIFLAGAVLLILFILNQTKLSGKKERITEMLTSMNMKYKTNEETRQIEAEEDKSAAVTVDAVLKQETEFNGLCSRHSVFSQLIPIFPLLGILGTVAGLMLEAQAGDIQAMTDSLGVAMSTTLSGLFWAIILKAFDALFPSRVINDVEVMLDDYYKKMDIAVNFGSKQDKK